MSMPLQNFEDKIVNCRKCPRLVAWREEVAASKRKAFQDEPYWGKPVPGFGDPNAKILIVGLAPGAHGSNRTGRMFTGDASGDFMYPALYKAGFANQPTALYRGDNLELKMSLSQPSAGALHHKTSPKWTKSKIVCPI